MHFYRFGDSANEPRPWRVYLGFFLALLGAILANFCTPVRDLFSSIGEGILDMGFFGPLLLILFNGLIIIPLALPYLVFELVIALSMPVFFEALCISIAGKMIGCTVSYIIAKFALRKRVHEYFRDITLYKAIDYVMETKPIRFSILLRFAMMPLFVKNYLLALPNTIDFKIYTLCAFATSIPTTAINLYLFRQAGDIVGFFDDSKTDGERIVSLLLIVFSLSVYIYVFFYTRKVVKELKALDKSNKMKFLQKELELESGATNATNA
jgi:uncharacterized membrane protein YdjX (TVP38/TMEM64 family)